MPRCPNLPVTKDSDKYLTNDDTADLKVVHSIEPGSVTNLGGLPARRESCLKEGLDVADRE